MKDGSGGKVDLSREYYLALFYSRCNCPLTLMLLANLANTKRDKKPFKITETLAYGYSTESTQ